MLICGMCGIAASSIAEIKRIEITSSTEHGTPELDIGTDLCEACTTKLYDEIQGLIVNYEEQLNKRLKAVFNSNPVITFAP